MSAVVSIVLTALTLLLAGSSRALAQASDPPAFITEDLEKDGPGVNGIPTCDDPPLRTDGDVSASQATCDTCPGGQSPVEIADTYNDTADPVLLHNGAVSYRATDLVIPGRGLHFELTRRYNSKRAQEDGVMGFGWEFAYDQRIDFDADPSWEARVTGRLQNGNNRVDTYVKAASSSDSSDRAAFTHASRSYPAARRCGCCAHDMGASRTSSTPRCPRERTRTDCS